MSLHRDLPQIPNNGVKPCFKAICRRLGRNPLDVRLRLMAMLGLSACIMLSAGCGKRDSALQHVPTSEKNAEDNNVNLYIWSDYLAPDTLTSFEKLTGIKVHASYFDSYETMEARVLTGHSGFDVVLPTTGSFAREIRSGAYLPFDKSQLPNLVNIDPAIMAKVSLSDPGNVHGVVYMWSTYGISFNKKMVEKHLPNNPLSSWHLVFDPAFSAKLAPCGINFIDDPVGVVQIVLKYLGKNPSTPSAVDFSEVEKTLMKVRPYVRSIDSSGEIQALANGDVCISVGYSGDMVQAGKRAREAGNGVELGYVIPDEGSLVGFDLLAIPRDAPHPANAYRLINYLMDPQVAANITNSIANANANLAATALLDPSIVSNPAIYPTHDEQQRLFVQSETTDDQARTITRIWQRFRTGQ